LCESQKRPGLKTPEGPVKTRAASVDEGGMELAYIVFVLLIGMGMSFLRNRAAIPFQGAARAIVGPQASVWSMRVVAVALISLFAAGVVAPLFLVPGW
jgi:hypothetical protein